MDRRELLAYERFKAQAQYYRWQTHELEGELRVLRPERYRADQRIDRLEQRCEKLAAENKALKQKLADLTAQLKHKPPGKVPSFVKANTNEEKGSLRMTPFPPLYNVALCVMEL